MKNFILAFTLFIFSGLFNFAWAEPVQPKILYIPLDNRPVNDSYVKQIIKSTNTRFFTLPNDYLAKDLQGESKVEEAWTWLMQKAQSADIAVLSADTLIYGGLVPSRRHNLDSSILQERLERFKLLKQKYPRLKIYIFSTVLRSPKASQGGAEPDYYAVYGPKIFRYTSLWAKNELGMLSPEEKNEMQALKSAVPEEYMQDWLNRRDKNFAVNQQLVALTKSGVIDYLSLGRDDTAVYSLSTKEYLQLSKEAEELYSSKFSSTHKFSTFCGVDDLGLILLARAFNNYRTVKVMPIYAPGKGGATIANYEDEPIEQNTVQHIFAAGAIPAPDMAKADMLFLINTPFDGKTKEAGSAINQISSEPLFIEQIKAAILTEKPVALADIAFSNGADNNLMEALKENKLLYKLNSYAGWNTAGNSLGFALGQGLLSDFMQDKQIKNLLTVRYLDDWGYQSNVRTELGKTIIKEKKIDKNNLNSSPFFNQLKEETQANLVGFQYKNLKESLPFEFSSDFPWNRLFEIEISSDI